MRRPVDSLLTTLVAFGAVALAVALLAIVDLALPRPWDGVVLEGDVPGSLDVREVVAGSGAALAGIQPGYRNYLSLPFVAFSKHPIILPVGLYVAFALFVVVGTSNAVNLTDGLDGLAIGPVMISAGTYLIWAYIAGTTFRFQVSGKLVSLPRYFDIAPNAAGGEMAIYCGAMIGAGIGFLWYNTYPAQVFMGDVGSLSLGGGLGMLAIFT